MRLVDDDEVDPALDVEEAAAPSAEVIRLSDARDMAPATEVERYGSGAGCPHINVIVYRGDVDLKCKACGAKVVAAWWVLQLSRRWKRAHETPAAMAEMDLSRVHESVKKLRAEESRLRSRVSRLRKTADEPARQPFSARLEQAAKNHLGYLVRLQVEKHHPWGDRDPGHAEVVALVDDSTAKTVHELIKKLLTVTGSEGSDGQ